MDSLVADYGSSSEDNSSDSEIEKVDNNNKSSSTSKSVLPPPSFDNIDSNSVFKNPYIEAENAKSAILEKHVKMIPSKEFLTTINGKQICWMYRKGKCRFGSNCKYAHDTELYNQDSNSSKLEETQSPIEDNIVAQVQHNTCSTKDNLEFEKDNNKNINKKKRPGLSQNIVPGKKVMKMYYSSGK